jgi:tRNA pseudouridine55 synthase
MSPQLEGYLNVLKPPGMTSHDVVAALRRISGVRRIGHAGTLDPAAVGVLPIALGRATRTLTSPAWGEKVYWADVCLGAATSTDDAGGEVIRSGDWTGLDLSSVEEALDGFVGSVTQQPPAFSAVHVDGERSYRRARRGIGVLPPARSVFVDGMRVVGWRPPLFSVLLQARSGVYVRSIARDLGQRLGCFAHLAGLVRTRVGPFQIGEALDLGRIAAVAADGAWADALWSTDCASLSSPAVLIAEARARDFAHGRAWQSSSPAHGASNVRVYAEAGILLGLARADEQGRWQPSVVLSDALGLTGGLEEG